MDPADLEGSDIVVAGEAAQTDTPGIDIVGLDVDTEVKVGVVLVIVVGSGDCFEGINVSEGFDFVVFKLEPSLGAGALVEVWPGECQ